MFAALLRASLLWLAERRWMGRLALRLPFLRRVPLRFVAGTTLEHGIAAVRAVNRAGAAATVDILGESVTDQSAAERSAAGYVSAIERIAAEELDANVSLKLSQMGLDLGNEICLAVLRPVVEAGKRHGIFVRVDMESSAYTDQTLEVVNALRAEGFDIGPVIQAYLHRSAGDVERLAAEQVRVRVCKGAYAEEESIAWHDRMAVNGSFVDLVTTLLEADAYPGVATHDPAMIEAVARAAHQRGIGPAAYEFQMLYGVRRDLQRQLVEKGYRMRIYVPFGTEWYPYFMRRLAERPANVLFIVRSLFGERA